MDDTQSKLVRAWVTSVLLGEAPQYSFRGTRSEKLALCEALYATQLFETELTKESATVESVVNALQRKHRATAKFEKQLGISWPL